MNYKTGIPITQPATPAFRAMAQQGLTAQSPMAFAGQHDDVYAGLAQKNAMNFDRAAQAANNTALQQARDVQMQMALRGLEQVAQERRNAEDIAARRRQAAFGQVGGMLNGLIGDLFS